VEPTAQVPTRAHGAAQPVFGFIGAHCAIAPSVEASAY